MSVKQISIFLENKPGFLAEVTKILAQNSIDMRAFSLAESNDFGIARIIVDDVFKTTTVLRDAGYINSVIDILAVVMDDVPGGLSKVLTVLAEAQVNVEYMYAFLGGKTGGAYMVFKVADHDKAIAALYKYRIRMVDQDELGEL
ncbi:MAG: ACT domain-containing protein [Clostridia bacterium]|nr:ACT domain-containing protein [Clostridia bacterium]